MASIVQIASPLLLFPRRIGVEIYLALSDESGLEDDEDDLDLKWLLGDVRLYRA